MKRNFRLMSKAISLLLALTMILSASSTVFSSNAAENEQAPMLSGEELLKLDSNDMARQLAEASVWWRSITLVVALLSKVWMDLA